jgi:hypothetical protein
MVMRMADGERSQSDLAHSRQVMTPAGNIVDCGVARLEVTVQGSPATEITNFINDKVFVEEVNPARHSATPAADVKPIGLRLLALIAACFRGMAWLIRSLFGIASLILLLAVLAAIPVVNLLALGYLLEVEGRLARSGKLRDAFPLIDLAPRLGSIVLGVWAWVFPLRLLSHAAADARLIDPGSFSDVGLHLLVDVLAVLVTIHLCLALARGGSLWSFFGPVVLPVVVIVGAVLVLAFAKLAIIALAIMALTTYLIHRRNTVPWFVSRVKEWFLLPIVPLRGLIADLRRLATPGYWTDASVVVRDFFAGLRIRHHFLLGLKGYAGAMLWLVIPTALFATARKTEGGPLLVTLFGGFLLIIVLSWERSGAFLRTLPFHGRSQCWSL